MPDKLLQQPQPWQVGKTASPAQAVILLVDDSRLTQEMLRLSLSKHGYRFLSANNGKEALEVLARHPEVELIILDLIMPQMDGFEFLSWRAKSPEATAIPVIVNSSLDDFESIIRALQMDSYDYFTKPLSARDLELVLPLKIRNAVNARRLMAEMALQNEIMRRERKMAARYQQFLLPQEVDLQGIKVAYLFEPCTGVGGDYFDFFPLPRGAVGFVVADVSGHGMASAMTASIVRALMPGYLERFRSPQGALTALNDDLVRLTQEDTFVTAFAGLYEPDQRLLTWSTAGHPPPVLFPRGGPPLNLEESSPFLGVFYSGNPLVAYQDHACPLAEGDRLVLYTDGLTEAPDPLGRPYGLARLTHLLDSWRSKEVETLTELIWQDLSGYVQGELPDDVAFIAMDF
ncbi:MAG: fused response regulator/phosphatase [Deltaproteobacteria bacterium]|nr:fused response regulator/phosphatase [Deltaproteobacteria bacterium]